MVKIFQFIFTTLLLTLSLIISSELAFASISSRETNNKSTEDCYHPIHISIYKFDYRPKKKSIQVTMRFFIDDIQEAWVKENRYLKSDYYDIDDKRAHDLVLDIMKDYLPIHLTIHTDNKSKQLEILDFEIKGDAIQFYVRINQAEDFNTLYVKCDVLLDDFENQENIIFLTKNSIKESARLNMSKTEVLIKCK